MTVIGCCSMYANPLGPHHVAYLEDAKSRCDTLIVILNNDEQAVQKHGRTFMTVDERLAVVRSLWCVDFVVVSMDKDRSVCETLKWLRPHKFFNGGDQKSDSN